LTLKSLSGAVVAAMVSQVSSATIKPQCDIQPTKQCVYQTIVKQISELPVEEREQAQKTIGYQNLEELLGRVAPAREIEVVKASHRPYFSLTSLAQSHLQSGESLENVISWLEKFKNVDEVGRHSFEEEWTGSKEQRQELRDEIVTAITFHSEQIQNSIAWTKHKVMPTPNLEQLMDLSLWGEQSCLMVEEISDGDLLDIFTDSYPIIPPCIVDRLLPAISLNWQEKWDDDQEYIDAFEDLGYLDAVFRFDRLDIAEFAIQALPQEDDEDVLNSWRESRRIIILLAAKHRQLALVERLTQEAEDPLTNALGGLVIAAMQKRNTTEMAPHVAAINAIPSDVLEEMTSLNDDLREYLLAVAVANQSEALIDSIEQLVFEDYDASGHQRWHDGARFIVRLFTGNPNSVAQLEALEADTYSVKRALSDALSVGKNKKHYHQSLLQQDLVTALSNKIFNFNAPGHDEEAIFKALRLLNHAVSDQEIITSLSELPGDNSALIESYHLAGYKAAAYAMTLKMQDSVNRIRTLVWDAAYQYPDEREIGR